MYEFSRREGEEVGLSDCLFGCYAEQREALLSLLPEMTAVQLEDLSNILEASYLQVATKDEDAKLSGELKNIETEYEEKISQINEIRPRRWMI